MSNIKNRKESGFTIIEVLIVLAIAGLIMLIVFLAVPALQRNSRNTSIKNDASNIAGAISEFASNNNGAMPGATGAVAQSGSTVTIGEAASTAKAVAKVNGGTTVAQGTAKPTTLAANNITVVTRYNCDGTASTRQSAVFYAVESSGGTSVLCVES